MRSTRFVTSVAFTTLLAFAACKTTNSENNSNIESAGAVEPSATVLNLPQILPSSQFEQAVNIKLQKSVSDPSKLQEATERLSSYLGFLGIPLDPRTGKNSTLDRLFKSSVQFALCDSFEDWECLEEKSVVEPTSTYRVETVPNLGKPIPQPSPLELEIYFTNQWDKNPADVEPKKLLVSTLADKIDQEAKDGLWMALYGIDDINGSMQPVYDAILAKKKAGVPIKGVFDIDTTKSRKMTKTEFPVNWTMVKSQDPKWVFAAKSVDGIPRTELGFKYQSTPLLIQAINEDATDEIHASARVEWPDSGIMHNKFMVFKNGENLSVWSGTSNISKTCMGLERNSNAGILIRNNAVAQSFLAEFNQMYQFDSKNVANSRYFTNASSAMTGRFHTNKHSVASRYFTFPDSTELRVHFAPTDDGEHRSIIPMLLSARKGDDIRIAMFGGGGVEFVRAFQYAAAKGAKVRILFDSFTGMGATQWVKDKKANLTQPNPYASNPSGSIEVKINSWCGLNHLKAGTLTRGASNPKGAEVFIIGSQNWSITGNDLNDENMLSIRNRQTGVPAGTAFNNFFDERLWPNTIDIGQKRPPCPTANDDDEDDEGSSHGEEERPDNGNSNDME